MTGRLAKLLYRTIWQARKISSQEPRFAVLHQRENTNHRNIWSAHEYVHCTQEPSFVEPSFGYTITERGHILDDSLPTDDTDNKVAWRVALPSPFTWNNPKTVQIVHFPSVVSLRHLYEWNYYHFYLDVLGKLQLLDEIGISMDTPFVLGRYVHEKSFAREILQHGSLAKMNWVIPDKENRMLVHADKVIYCQTLQRYRDRMDFVTNLMQAPLPPNDINNGSAGERIFLVRKPPASRNILNLQEIEPILAHYGFRLVDMDGMPLQEQQVLMSKTRFLIAIHGAGMTNMIYRHGAPLSIIELHARNYVTDDMKNMAQEYGYVFYRLAGTPNQKPPQLADFSLSSDDLRNTIEQMISDAEK